MFSRLNFDVHKHDIDEEVGQNVLKTNMDTTIKVLAYFGYFVSVQTNKLLPNNVPYRAERWS